MQILLDTAKLEELKSGFFEFPYDGITTNPSILAKEKMDPLELLLQIKKIIGNTMLHVQVLSTKSDEIIQEAFALRDALDHEHFYVKIPVTNESLKAIYTLSKEGFHVTGTAVYSVMQALLCAKAGAHYIAPYVNRLDNLGYNGVELVKQMHTAIKTHGYQTKIVGASFKNVQQVQELCVFGIEAVTLPYDIAQKLAYQDMTLKAISDFQKDFEVLGKRTVIS